MAKIKLDALSVKELVELRADLDTTIARRKQTEKVELRRKMAELAAGRGLSLADVFSTGKSRKGRVVAAKYRNPDNPAETWTGRGRPPRWLQAKVKKGAKRDDFLIA